MSTEFVGFPKIPRLKRDIVITEKIDGTNACVLVPEDDGPLLAGKRTSWVTPENDNFGFAKWVKENEDMLRRLGPGRHFGEWWGAGIQRRYGLTEKRFSLFNVHKWQDGVARPSMCHVVPVLYRGPNSDEAIASALEKLRTEGSVAAPGFMNPEGIVVFHTASSTLYKITLEKDEEPKGKAA